MIRAGGETMTLDSFLDMQLSDKQSCQGNAPDGIGDGAPPAAVAGIVEGRKNGSAFGVVMEEPDFLKLFGAVA